MSSLSQVLMENVGLTWLDLSGQHLAAELKNCSLGLERNCSLTHLCLNNCGLEDSSMSGICWGLSQNSKTNLRTIELKHNLITQDSGLLLVGCMLSHVGLETMHLAHNPHLSERVKQNVASPLVQQMAKVLGSGRELHHIRLRELDLSHTGILDAGCAHLFDHMHAQMSLTSVNLSGNLLGLSGSRHLVDMVRIPGLPLVFLGLSHCGLTEHCAIRIIKALSERCSIKELDMSHNMLFEQAGLAWGETLSRNSKLRSLNLSHNQLGDAGLLAIANGLLQSSAASGLQSLNLQNCSLDSELQADLLWPERMGQALNMLGQLTHLDISENEIGNAGAIHMFYSLAGNSKIQVLHLRRLGLVGHASKMSSSANTLTDRRVMHSFVEEGELKFMQFTLLEDDKAASTQQGFQFPLQILLHRNKGLTALDVSGNGLTREAAMALSKEIREHESLQSFTLEHSPLDPQCSELVIDALMCAPSLTSVNLSGGTVAAESQDKYQLLLHTLQAQQLVSAHKLTKTRNPDHAHRNPAQNWSLGKALFSAGMFARAMQLEEESDDDDEAGLSEAELDKMHVPTRAWHQNLTEFHKDASFTTWELEEGAIQASEDDHEKCVREADQELAEVALEFDVMEQIQVDKRTWIKAQMAKGNSNQKPLDDTVPSMGAV
eukprot:TRINITY_DN61280_c0_g1_i1.p1 TRINITY_DN61280_c0_g1~~TRINITY_DN61280_c0_g1_i1.p1  ORF type:complete len:661 (+),score=162.79 TRINITY_DN61280_c0_g1_i1:127-2109(+)